MVHQDTDHSWVTYAEVSCRYLVQALNDPGLLGTVTWHLLLLQEKAIGVALPQPTINNPCAKLFTILASQLATLQRFS